MRRRLVALAIAVVLPLPGLAAEVTVQPGETLSQIADRLGISMTRLMKLNGITNPDHVESGSKLTVPSSVSSSGRAKGTSTSSNANTTKVTVKDGETLSEIADRHGMSVNELVRLNALSNADHVETGSTLRVKAIAVTSSRSADGPCRGARHCERCTDRSRAGCAGCLFAGWTRRRWCGRVIGWIRPALDLARTRSGFSWCR